MSLITLPIEKIIAKILIKNDEQNHLLVMCHLIYEINYFISQKITSSFHKFHINPLYTGTSEKGAFWGEQ